MKMTIAAAIALWLDSESMTFTALCGESFTRREVMATAIGTIAIIAVAAAAGGMA